MSELGYPQNDPSNTWLTFDDNAGHVFQIKQVSGPTVATGVVQAAFIAAMGALTSAAPAAVTSAQVATPDGSDAGTTQTLANALKVAHNAAQADIVALRATLAATQADVVSLRTKLNAEIGALEGTGKPQAAS